tara:strand:- start:10100 stop:10336 length:237 start_codon:yes stop_codon:yes gene_type:complete
MQRTTTRQDYAFMYLIRDLPNEEWLSMLDGHPLAKEFTKAWARDAILLTIYTWFENKEIISDCIELVDLIKSKAKEME